MSVTHTKPHLPLAPCAAPSPAGGRQAMAAARFILLAFGFGSAGAMAADLAVQVSGVQHARGQVKLMLFDHETGFRKEDRARTVLALPASAGTVEARFRDLPAGRYAIVAYHDEDGDGKLNLRFGMFPEEGYGLSNNPRVSGPPQFKDSAFDLADTGTSIDIHLNY